MAVLLTFFLMNRPVFGLALTDNRHLLVDWQEKGLMRRISPYIRQSDQALLQKAENIASQIEGVLTLDNRITVKAKADITSDAGTKASIVDELFWIPHVDSDRIGVRPS
jgi:osmotically-inducible protein OsmY